MTDPWKALRERPDINLVRAPIAERGRYYHRLRTIVIRTGMLIVQERATLWHELVHADRGDESPCDPHLDQRQELWCAKAAARAAIPIEDLADALLWSSYLDEQADQLKTTPETVQIRLDHLHPSERGYLKRRIALRDGAA